MVPRVRKKRHPGVVLFGKFARCLDPRADSRIGFHGAVGTLAYRDLRHSIWSEEAFVFHEEDQGHSKIAMVGRYRYSLMLKLRVKRQLGYGCSLSSARNRG